MRFLRYPGGKARILSFMKRFLPDPEDIRGRYIEPFLGGGAVFFYIKPSKAILSDLNRDLIELYKGIKRSPHKVWETFEAFPKGKKAYYRIRDCQDRLKPLYRRASRTLYLNRTCFKGMWRHSSNGNFNVGYGGEERRWAITHENLMDLSKILANAILFTSDFEYILDIVEDGDFIFLDPPYKPGKRELKESHYSYGAFTYDDQVRLFEKLREIESQKKINWIMTNSSHAKIRRLYRHFRQIKIPKGTSNRIGIQTSDSKEILIFNY